MHIIFAYNYLCEGGCLFLRVGNRLADNFPKRLWYTRYLSGRIESPAPQMLRDLLNTS